jgi:hypothetical protein
MVEWGHQNVCDKECYTLKQERKTDRECVRECVCVCVTEREREIDRKKKGGYNVRCYNDKVSYLQCLKIYTENIHG